MSTPKFEFSYQTKTGYCKGRFNVFQNIYGAILIAMGDNTTTLTHQQVEDLGINVYDLNQFDHEDYLEYYKLNKTKK